MTTQHDTLALGGNQQANKMLVKLGTNFPEPERVLLSQRVIKINQRNKEQERALLMTNKAIYNLMPTNYSKCRRRIEISRLASVTSSQTSDEFVIHVPEEYDYRFKSKGKDILIQVLAEAYEKLEGKKLKISGTQQSSCESVTVTKNVARLQTREERLRRFQDLTAQTTESDDEEAADAANSKFQGNLMGGVETVKPDDFEFLKVLGRGSFAKVMLVRKKDTGEIFAMKILKKKAIIARNQVEHTNAERKILQQLTHPFLMQLRFAFQTDSKLYFVLDYYRGGELFFHLKKRRRFTEKEAQLFVAEVALALGHLHEKDVIYRDLKPENILVDHVGHVCLTDFGLSKDLGPESDNEAYTFCGTPEYLAPEIVMNLGHNKAVDWWSLGILLYELTVGIPPFYSQNVNEMYRKIQEAPLLFPPNLSNNCKSLCTKLLERDPKKRMGSGPDGVEEIKRHPFFSDLDFEKLYKKEIEPIYKPVVKGMDDTQNFDKQFTNEPVVDTYVAPTTLADQDAFEGFTYKPNESALG